MYPLQLRQLFNGEIGQGRYAAVIGEKVGTSRELSGSNMDGIGQFEIGLGSQMCGWD